MAHTALNYVSVLPAEALTLAEVLKNSGYHTVFLNSENPFITRRFGFHQGFDRAEDEGTGRDAAMVTDKFLSMLPRLGAGKFFAYLHYMDLHLPYSENEMTAAVPGPARIDSLRLEDVDAGVLRERTAEGAMSDQARAQVEALYDAQLAYVDRHLGRLFEGLREAGLDEGTLLVILADHGEEFWEHGNVEHGHTLYEELLHIPLILAGGGIDRAAVDTRISLVDLMPTVLDLVGIEHENMALHGQSLRPLMSDAPVEPAPRTVYAAGTLYGREKYCVIRGDDKLIVNTEDDSYKLDLTGLRSDAPYEVYSLEDDPLELNDLAGQDPRTVSELGRIVQELNHLGGLEKAKQASMDGELERRLRSVGYL
jgi:arylsulfatase A-like enzyme